MGVFMALSGCSIFSICRLSSFDSRREILSGDILQSAGPGQQAPKWSGPSGVLRCLPEFPNRNASAVLHGQVEPRGSHQPATNAMAIGPSISPGLNPNSEVEKVECANECAGARRLRRFTIRKVLAAHES
jgi:hypothetical protein